MDALAVARRYFDAWNRRDAAAVAGMFEDGGTYEDPTSGGPLAGERIGAHAEGLFGMIPDLSFEIVSLAASGDCVSAQWLMEGTNSGPLPGGPPSGRSVSLPGADFIDVREDRIAGVRGYFDQATMLAQLGLALNPMPAEPVGPFTFGTGVTARAGRRTKPGAFSVTVLNLRSEEERPEVAKRAEQIARELLDAEGFLGFIGFTAGGRMFTITAWDDVDSPGRLLAGTSHPEAVRHMYQTDGFTLGGMLSVWRPAALTVLVRCTTCGQLADTERTTTCSNGHPVEPPDTYF